MTSTRVFLDSIDPEKSRCYVDYNQEEAPKNSIKCLCYCRCSLVKQIPTSIPEQEYAILQFCSQNNLYIKAWYYDCGKSGALKLNKRLGLDKLMKDIKKGEKFVVCDISRIYREIRGITDIVGSLLDKKIGIYIITFNEGKEIIQDDDSEFLFNIMASVFQQERKTVKKRVKNAMNILSRSGKLRSKPRFGFKFIGKKEPYVIDEEAQKVIKYIAKLKKENENIKISEICRKLTEEYPCDKEKYGCSKWWPRKIKKIIEQNNL